MNKKEKVKIKPIDSITDFFIVYLLPFLFRFQTWKNTIKTLLE